jgi:hypothetical protein
MLRTRHEWINKFVAESGAIAGLQLDTVIENAELNTEELNLANCSAHRRLVSRATDELITRTPSSRDHARDLLCNLIGRNTYGAFAELAAYDWLALCDLRIAPQVKMDPSEVLGTNGSTLDGKIEHCDIYFDVKAFGSNGRLLCGRCIAIRSRCAGPTAPDKFCQWRPLAEPPGREGAGSRVVHGPTPTTG